MAQVRRALDGQGLRPGPRATRQRIMAGAGRLVARNGIRSTKVQDILVESEVSRRTFYQYFKGIDAVLEAIYAELCQRLLHGMTQAIEEAESPPEKLLAAIEAYLDLQQEGQALLIFLQAEAVRPDSALAARRMSLLDSLVDLIDRTIQQTLEIGSDPYVYRALLIGIEGLVIHVQRDGSFSAADRDRVRAVMQAMMLSVLSSRTPFPPRPEGVETPPTSS